MTISSEKYIGQDDSDADQHWKTLGGFLELCGRHLLFAHGLASSLKEGHRTAQKGKGVLCLERLGFSIELEPEKGLGEQKMRSERSAEFTSGGSPYMSSH